MYLLEKEGYQRFEDNLKIVFEKEVRKNIYTITFHKHIEMFECYAIPNEHESDVLLLDVKELLGINEIVKELGWS